MAWFIAKLVGYEKENALWLIYNWVWFEKETIHQVTLLQCQGSHGTGKTGNLVLTFSRQGKHREFCCNTGKIIETQEKYFWLYLLLQKACFPSYISLFFCLPLLGILSSFRWLFLILFLPVYLLFYFLSISHWLQVSTKLIWTVLKTNWNNVIWNMYIQEFFKM